MKYKKLIIYLILLIVSGIAYIVFDIWIYLMQSTIFEKIMILTFFLLVWLFISILGSFCMHEFYLSYKKKEKKK